MECQVCGAPVYSDSVYCQKCGKKVGERFSEDVQAVSMWLKGEMENATGKERQYYQMFIDKIEERRFETLEIHRSSVGGLKSKLNLDKLIYEKNGKIYVNCKKPENWLKLTAALLVNEFDCIATEASRMQEEFHNIMMAPVEAAYRQCKDAMRARDASKREKMLQNALNECNRGMVGLEEGINTKLAVFAKIPRNAVAKLFCAFKLQTVETDYNLMLKEFPWYCHSVRLMMFLYAQDNEPEMLQSFLENVRPALKRMTGSQGYRRLREMVESNSEVWDGYVNRLQMDMYSIEKYITTGTITITRLEDNRDGK